MKFKFRLLLPFLVFLLVMSQGITCAIAETNNTAQPASKEDVEKLLKRIQELEAEIGRLKKLERELAELKAAVEKAIPPEETDEINLVVEPPRKFLGLFGEQTDTVPSLDLSGFMTVSFKYTNIEKRGRFTFDVIEIDPRFNLFEELQVVVDLEFREPTPEEDDFYVEQAFVAWAPYADNSLEITMGRFNSILGIEKPDPPNNFLASHSFLYNKMLPADQTGAMIAYEAGDMRLFFAATNSFGYDNSGERISTDNNFDKTWTVRLEYRPSEQMALGLNLIAGPEHDDDNSQYRYTIDADFQCACVDVYYLGVEVLYGFEESEIGNEPSWWGVMGIANYTFSQQLEVSLRLEYVDDFDGGAKLGATAPGRGPRIWSGALALRFHPLTNMDFVMEYKVDGGDDAYFEPDNNQRTFSVMVTVEF